jgi:hypothetical protein
MDIAFETHEIEVKPGYAKLTIELSDHSSWGELTIVGSNISMENAKQHLKKLIDDATLKEREF